MNGLGGSVPCPVARRLVAERFTQGSLMDPESFLRGSAELSNLIFFFNV